MQNGMYDPEIPGHRAMLALDLKAMLIDAGFVNVMTDETTHEEVWEREVHTWKDRRDVKVCVYTSIVDNEVRDLGHDSIKIGTYVTTRDGRRAQLFRETRTHRTGFVNEIVERTLGRMREAYGKAMNVKTCRKCGCPLALSKPKWKKNKDGKREKVRTQYCADICWKTDEEKKRDQEEWRRGRNRRWRFTRYR